MVQEKKILDTIAQSIFDKKGFNILALDVRKISSLTDYFIIAEGNVDRHVRALSLAIQDRMEQMGLKPLHVEGEQTADWLVIDYGEVVIHLFIPELRDKYGLENLWHDGKIVDLKIDVRTLENE